MLHQLNHRYIIKMLDYYEGQNNFYIVMEKPEKCVELFDYINQKRVLDEGEARVFFRQIVTAVQYCHSKGVVHRDIKDDNILIDLKNREIKLIDFGVARSLSDKPFNTFAGENG